jgi:hypothetical protein
LIVNFTWTLTTSRLAVGAASAALGVPLAMW